tara:strand:+ start:1339 stop:2385 length:1047 start_codon:yes stop_codon:yes gene_type:complete
LRNYKEHLINQKSSLADALARLNTLDKDTILFVVDDKDKLIGSLTDGDVRRGMIKGLNVNSELVSFIQDTPKYILKNKVFLDKIIEFRKNNFKIIPVIDDENIIVDIVNFRLQYSCLSIDVVIMAGGLGSRLKSLTKDIPKPLLKVGSKSIIEHNIDSLAKYGSKNFYISVRHMANLIMDKIGNGSSKSIKISYIQEDKPLGTIGSLSMIKDFQNEVILLTNSDILTDLNYEEFYLDFIKNNADMSMVTIPYKVNIPYAVVMSNKKNVTSIDEKPTYTYYSNAGIYLIKKTIIDKIPKDEYFDATDLMDILINENLNLTSYVHNGYWLDIGRPEDYERAQKDITKIFN